LCIRDHSHRIEPAQRFTKYARLTMTKPFVCDTRERYCRQARPQTGPKHSGEINGIFDEQDNMRARAHAQRTQATRYTPGTPPKLQIRNRTAIAMIVISSDCALRPFGNARSNGCGDVRVDRG
jgi:hypothetical protein